MNNTQVMPQPTILGFLLEIKATGTKFRKDMAKNRERTVREHLAAAGR